MNILFLTTILPIKAKSGGEIVTKQIITGLISNGADVDVVGYVRPDETNLSLPNNYNVAEARVIETQGHKKETLKWLLSSLVKKVPFSCEKYVGAKFLEIVNAKLKQKQYDYIFIDHTQMLWICDYFSSEQRVILISHNVESQLYDDLANDSSNWLKRNILRLESSKLKKIELSSIKKINQIWSLSENDSAYYSKLNNSENNSLTCITFDALPLLEPDLQPLPEANYDVSLLGTWSWDANMKGLRWFFDNVYPLLPMEITIQVAGKGADWLADKFKNVKYKGFVEDAHEFLSRSKVIAIPSISGAGVQIKTLDAITIGRPIVASEFALRGLEDIPSYVYSSRQASEMAKQIMTNLERKVSQNDLLALKHECNEWYSSKINKFKEVILGRL
ncbi:glycosyltransferase [Klebsiella quasipneumoniae]|uniref:glycosyltransferase n=1 Tax=Klebsiella quasipneumoniae TaxID=1463165 RepID=UPI00103399AB|nr:glycosyltransferase [Klebsiella quasipneumoniae]MBR7420031.1 glycosyltransferase family 4 protein [Klebsiella quasipneumoniae]MDE4646259.1 glycosyltransferase [Klebsiella quasipneumoniae subsp. similipneumoniae]VGJ60094.1 sugar transferase, PEP-CTERM/EpsH1 system associated [Klebsiella quasipneumoniae]HBR1484756.1 glycosyltransferase [Klebsiella quasipneumoniae subsp. similipneumoniae]HBR1935044.1 glycosyltransferase [Klebsiella quasipneumoniae subsp. similipneumoniae]